MSFLSLFPVPSSNVLLLTNFFHVHVCLVQVEDIISNMVYFVEERQTMG